MYTLFISDLHFDADKPHLTAIFLRFLAEHARQADALYILGDFFEVWLGDDVQSAFTREISVALRKLSLSGTRVYFMHGNRDFLIGQDFLHRSGIELLQDPTIINLYGTRALLLHGDTLCWDDLSYQRLRRIVRNPVYQGWFLKLPLVIRRFIAHYLRRQSANKHYDVEAIAYSDVTGAALINALQSHKPELIIHGHTHRPCIQRRFESNIFTRIVLSDWEIQGNALRCEQNGSFRLIYFT